MIDAAVGAERRALFLQVIAEGLGTHLADNLDHLFHPFGHELPAPAEVGRRIADALDVLERADELWANLGDPSSRDLLLRFLAYRALGPAHIRLQLEPGPYRQSVMALNRLMVQAVVARVDDFPLEWQLHLYDFTSAGMPIRVIGAPLPLASTLAFSQYAYRDVGVGARPKVGDVALDIGGCWGETALWLAHAVGETGFVHTFEPTPRNRALLEQNLELNPQLAKRIAVWSEAASDRADETVWVPDVIAAGATVSETDQGEVPMTEALTETVDRIVAAERVLPPSFIKIDVEGAELSVLAGAADTIAEYRPTLAIAAYHRPDDLVAIPEFIASLGVRYRWYLQCSTMTDVDTVAFGVPV